MPRHSPLRRLHPRDSLWPKDRPRLMLREKQHRKQRRLKKQQKELQVEESRHLRDWPSPHQQL